MDFVPARNLVSLVSMLVVVGRQSSDIKIGSSSAGLALSIQQVRSFEQQIVSTPYSKSKLEQSLAKVSHKIPVSVFKGIMSSFETDL